MLSGLLKVQHLISGGSQEHPLHFLFPQPSALEDNQSIVKRQFIIMVNSADSRQIDLV